MGLLKKNNRAGRKSSNAIIGRRFVGLDIDDDSIKFVQISGKSVDNFSIEDCGIVSLPKGVIEDGRVLDVDELVVILQQLKIGAKKVIASLPINLVTTETFIYNSGSDESIEERAEFEMAQISDIGDINYDYYSRYNPAGQEEIVLVGAKKDDIEPRIDAIVEAGLDLIYMDINDYAKANSFTYWLTNNDFSKLNSTIAAVDVSKKDSRVLLMNDGQVLFAQTIAVGISSLVTEIQSATDIGGAMSYADAERAKDGLINNPAMYESAINSFGLRLAQEIRRVIQLFNTIQTGAEVRGVYLSGDDVLQLTTNEIANRLSVSVQIAQPLQDVAGSHSSHDLPKLTTAFGLALRGML